MSLVDPYGLFVLPFIIIPKNYEIPDLQHANKKKCSSITVKRNDIHLFGNDQYGHWWIELGDTESYGWWPMNPVGYKETFFGTTGELNGQTSFGGTPTMDPHQILGDKGEESFSPYVDNCGENPCDNAKECIRKFANNYSGDWSWPFGQNCHSFQKAMMDKCGLSK